MFNVMESNKRSPLAINSFYNHEINCCFPNSSNQQRAYSGGRSKHGIPRLPKEGRIAGGCRRSGILVIACLRRRGGEFLDTGSDGERRVPGFGLHGAVETLGGRLFHIGYTDCAGPDILFHEPASDIHRFKIFSGSRGLSIHGAVKRSKTEQWG